MTRIITIGDTHFQHGHWRNADRLTSMEQVVREGLALPHLGAWIHLGDIWHAKPTDDDLEAVAEFFQRMAEQAPVVALLGNHGAAGYSLLMRRLKGRYPIIVMDAPQVLAVPLASGGTLSLAAIPYPQKGVLVAQGVAPGDIKPTAEQAMDIICMDLAAQLQQATGPKLLIGHATIAGATASTGQPMGIEHDIAVTASMLARFGDTPKIFGHIHKAQTLHGATYAGSTSATDYGETEPKRYLVIEFDGEHSEIVSHPLNTPRLFHVEGELTREGFTWRVRKGPDGPADKPPLKVCPACAGTGDGRHDPREGTLHCETCVGPHNPSGQVVDWAGCDVRVRFRYHQAERELLGPARERIKTIFAGARHLELEPVATQTREVRAPEVVAAQTLPDKLKAWARLTDTAWSGEIERCAALLLAGEEGEPVVAETEARLNPLMDMTASRDEALIG